MTTRQVWTQIITADLEDLGPLSATLKRAQTTGQQNLRPIPLFVRDRVQYYLDLSHGDQWPEQDADAQAVAGVQVFGIEDEHSEFDFSLRRCGEKGADGLIKSGLILGCLMHHRDLSKVPKNLSPSVDHLQFTGFFVLMDSMNRSLWITAAECGVYGEEQEQGLRRLAPGPDDDLEFCDSFGKVGDEFMVWGRAFPDCKKRNPKMHDLYGTVKVSNGAWWQESIDEPRKASDPLGKSYRCRVVGRGWMSKGVRESMKRQQAEETARLADIRERMQQGPLPGNEWYLLEFSSNRIVVRQPEIVFRDVVPVITCENPFPT